MADNDVEFAERLVARTARIRQELSDEIVPILGAAALPDGLASRADEVEAILLDELVYARHLPVHEGRRPPYGSMVVEDLASFEPEVWAQPSHASTAEAIRALRPLVDGQHTMLVRDLRGLAAVSALSVGDELDLVDVTSRVAGVAVQRLPDRRIRVGVRGGIALCDEGEWSFRPLAGALVKQLNTQLALPAQERLQRMTELGSLLEFCLHRLSPHGIGATLVVNLASEPEVLIADANDQGAHPALALNAFNRSDQALLSNILAAVDGACLIAADGRLARYKVKLSVSERAEATVREHGGTRHTSAKRFSFDHPEALLYVVSADGPVTIFCAGTAIASVRAGSDVVRNWALETESAVRARAHSVTETATCPECETPYILNVVRDDEGGSEARSNCGVCGQLLREHSHALAVTTRIRRPWEV